MTKKPLILAEREEVEDSFFIQSFSPGLLHSQVRRLAYHRIFLMESGTGSLTIDGTLFKISGRTLFLAAKGQLISFDIDVNAAGYELCFGDCFWERAPQSSNNCKAVLFNDVANNQNITLNEGSYHELLLLFSMVDAEFKRENYINKLDALAAYLKIIMIKIANINDALSGRQDNHDHKLYSQFLLLVNDDCKTTHEVSYFASQLGIPARKLSDLCRKYCGKGAKDVINDQLIVEAKRFLQFSSMPVKEVAYALNFSTAEQFSQFFKKNTQLSPQRYRSEFVNIDMQFS